MKRKQRLKGLCVFTRDRSSDRPLLDQKRVGCRRRGPGWFSLGTFANWRKDFGTAHSRASSHFTLLLKIHWTVQHDYVRQRPSIAVPASASANANVGELQWQATQCLSRQPCRRQFPGRDQAKDKPEVLDASGMGQQTQGHRRKTPPAQQQGGLPPDPSQMECQPEGTPPTSVAIPIQPWPVQFNLHGGKIRRQVHTGATSGQPRSPILQIVEKPRQDGGKWGGISGHGREKGPHGGCRGAPGPCSGFGLGWWCQLASSLAPSLVSSGSPVGAVRASSRAVRNSLRPEYFTQLRRTDSSVVAPRR